MGQLDPPLSWTGLPPDSIPESLVQRAALDLLKAVGWATFTQTVAWKSDAGWLDIYAVHPVWRRTVYVEVKRESGKTSEAQDAWLAVHLAAGNEAMVLRPSNWEEFVRFVVHPGLLEGRVAGSPIHPAVQHLELVRQQSRVRRSLPAGTRARRR